MTTHAVYVETCSAGFAVMQAERGNGSRCVTVARHAGEALEAAEKAAAPTAEYAVRPEWCKPGALPGAAFVW